MAYWNQFGEILSKIYNLCHGGGVDGRTSKICCINEKVWCMHVLDSLFLPDAPSCPGAVILLQVVRGVEFANCGGHGTARQSCQHHFY